jgi:hypothetical protein
MHHALNKSAGKIYVMWKRIFLEPGREFLVPVIPSPRQLDLWPVNRISGGSCGFSYSISQTGWRDPPVEDVKLSEGNSDRDSRGAQLPHICICATSFVLEVLLKDSLLCCQDINFYRPILYQVLHLLAGKNRSTSKLCLLFREFSSAQFCDVGKFSCITQQCRWEDNIKMDLQKVRGGCGDWMELAQDRDRWRALVSTVMNFRGL